MYHETSVIETDKIGAGTDIWHFCHVSKGVVIGKNCQLGQNVYIGPNVQIGDGTKIMNNVFIPEHILIGNDVFIAAGVSFINLKNPRAAISRRDLCIGSVVRNGATIGANATIMCGVTLGEYAVVGAGAVVLKDVPAYAVAVGNPARNRKFTNEEFTE